MTHNNSFMELIEFTLTDEWEIVTDSVSKYTFETTLNELKKTHDIKFLQLGRTDLGYISYIIAKKLRK